MDLKELIEERIAPFPIYQYEFLKSVELTFEPKVRSICRSECPMYGTTWSCPPAVGTPEECRARCLAYEDVLLIATVAEVADIANMDETLATRREHERITREVRDQFTELGRGTMVLSSEACRICESCAWPDSPCRHSDLMFPCVESHCILVTQLAERFGMDFIAGAGVVTWFSLIFF